MSNEENMYLSLSDRRALSTIIASSSLNISTQANLSLRLEDCPRALTPSEVEYMRKLKSRLHKDSILMLKFAHRLKKKP